MDGIISLLFRSLARKGNRQLLFSGNQVFSKSGRAQSADIPQSVFFKESAIQ
jgi:hypothetical protein